MQVGQQVPARRISSIYYTMGLKNGLQSTTLYTIYSLTKTESSVVQIFFLPNLLTCTLDLANCKNKRPCVGQWEGYWTYCNEMIRAILDAKPHISNRLANWITIITSENFHFMFWLANKQFWRFLKSYDCKLLLDIVQFNLNLFESMRFSSFMTFSSISTKLSLFEFVQVYLSLQFKSFQVTFSLLESSSLFKYSNSF